MASGADRRSTPSNEYKGVSKAVVIARQIKILLSSYRRDDYADPEGFVTQVGALMERYPERVIVAATDPLNHRSIQRRHQFPPNFKEVADSLELEAAEQLKIAKALNVPAPVRKFDYVAPRNDPGCWVNCFVGQSSPSYAAALAFTESPNADKRAWRFGELRDVAGVWLSLNSYEMIRGGRGIGRTWQSPSGAAQREMRL
jgi:hypothetical protein